MPIAQPVDGIKEEFPCKIIESQLWTKLVGYSGFPSVMSA